MFIVPHDNVCEGNTHHEGKGLKEWCHISKSKSIKGNTLHNISSGLTGQAQSK